MNCGHCNTEILEKVIDQMKTLQHTSTIYLTEQMVNLAEDLARITPGNLKKKFFCGTVSEANEGALLAETLNISATLIISEEDIEILLNTLDNVLSNVTIA